MEQHIFELSKTLSPSLDLGCSRAKDRPRVSMIELSLLSGIMAHEYASFTIDDELSSLRIEWVQKYSI